MRNDLGLPEIAHFMMRKSGRPAVRASGEDYRC
jgi:hypothetical protein